VRCASVFSYRKKTTASKEKPEHLEFKLMNDQIVTNIPLKSQTDQKLPYILTYMGKPIIDQNHDSYESIETELTDDLQKIQASYLMDHWGVCTIHNKHLVFFHQQACEELLQEIGSKLHKNQKLSEYNIHLVKESEISTNMKSFTGKLIGEPISEHYQAWSWERGVGKTTACGSGACAIGSLVAQSDFHEPGSWTGVEMPGGTLFVKYTNNDSDVELIGCSKFVYRGTIDI